MIVTKISIKKKKKKQITFFPLREFQIMTMKSRRSGGKEIVEEGEVFQTKEKGKRKKRGRKKKERMSLRSFL